MPAVSKALPRKIIVFPFKPDRGKSFTGLGLGLHFFVGNVLALHTGLDEFWFGWRAQKIFPDPEELSRYCRDEVSYLDLPGIACEQQFRFIVSGKLDCGPGSRVDLVFTDAQAPGVQAVRSFEFNFDDGLLSFREDIMDWLDACGLPFPAEQIPKAMWLEKTNIEGLQAVGRALEKFYLNGYEKDATLIDAKPFEEAVALAPESYLALDLLGWALFRKNDYEAASIFFKKALAQNPKGASGVLSGLLRCSAGLGKVEEAFEWAKRIGDLRATNVLEHKALAAHLLAKYFVANKNVNMAIDLYHKATAWNPDKKLYANKLNELLLNSKQDNNNEHP